MAWKNKIIRADRAALGNIESCKVIGVANKKDTIKVSLQKQMKHKQLQRPDIRTWQ